MTSFDEEDETLAQFLESEVLSQDSDAEETTERPKKRLHLDTEVGSSPELMPVNRCNCDNGNNKNPVESGDAIKVGPIFRSYGESSQSSFSCHGQRHIESGNFSKIPPELFHHILKFLSSEDLISCSLVCRFLSFAASDEFLWRRLYCMRWGPSSTGKPRACAWKMLYIQRDREDMVEFVKNTPSEFKEYYIQMQAAKRSQAPLPSQMNDDNIILDKTVADQVSIWKSSRGLTDESVAGHTCSGNTCSYSQIGDVYLCEKTGRVHVCDDTCRETLVDSFGGFLVCAISGHCSERWFSSEEEIDNTWHPTTCFFNL
ncbi:F-box protein SKIP31 isoform X2 [Amborella trichopoda]|uniref:F-box protein SKIP31 isoform X2 n=1 Tax=Amborella trichopoda TaxID=13333 RepID=UPI0009BD47AE|nr:F-box protein SKIP31 isoform X2 [Amborella trichopoda]|eukprot:XP_020523474.1 F-box protein SKIP31 isoform X2 [Amborella trichopoda]